MKHRLLTAAALFIPAIASAQTRPVFDPARLSGHVQTLSSDAFEGRAPATRGEKMTIDYLVRELRAAGVQPGGDLVGGKRGWTQAVPLLKSDINGAPSLALNLGGTALPLTQGSEIAVRAPTNGSTSVALANAPLVFVGYGVTAPERGWDDYKGVDVRGKIAVMLINDPDFEGGDAGFGGKAMTYYGRWTYKYEEAARRGAAGVMIVHETEPASYGWNTVKNSNTNTMFDIVRKDPAAAHPAMESWIQRDLAVRLFGGEAQFLAAKAAARSKDFRPVPLAATFNARYDATSSVITSYNVAGLLPGKRQVLEYDLNAALLCLAGVAEMRLLAVHQDATGGRRLDAADDLHQRGLAGAVVADQGDHLARMKVERNALKRDDAVKDLAHVVQAQNRHGGGIRRGGPHCGGAQIGHSTGRPKASWISPMAGAPPASPETPTV